MSDELEEVKRELSEIKRRLDEIAPEYEKPYLNPFIQNHPWLIGAAVAFSAGVIVLLIITGFRPIPL